MVVLVDLDSQGSTQPYHTGHDLHTSYTVLEKHEVKHEEPLYQDERPNPNVNSFSQALGSYPYALATHHESLTCQRTLSILTFDFLVAV